jgi:hypothetical protein
LAPQTKNTAAIIKSAGRQSGLNSHGWLADHDLGSHSETQPNKQNQQQHETRFLVSQPPPSKTPALWMPSRRHVIKIITWYAGLSAGWLLVFNWLIKHSASVPAACSNSSAHAWTGETGHVRRK